MKTQRALAAKPTEYGGILFRSKTEALAAAWLDSLHQPWIYEPETIIGHEWYTPDFYLPEIDTLVEVKPTLFLWEVDRVREPVEQIGKTFVVIDRNQDNTFSPIDMYAHLDGCDPWSGWGANDDPVMGWHSGRSERAMSYGDEGGRLERPRFYIGAACYWRHLNGRDCPCTS